LPRIPLVALFDLGSPLFKLVCVTKDHPATIILNGSGFSRILIEK